MQQTVKVITDYKGNIIHNTVCSIILTKFITISVTTFICHIYSACETEMGGLIKALHACNIKFNAMPRQFSYKFFMLFCSMSLFMPTSVMYKIFTP